MVKALNLYELCVGISCITLGVGSLQALHHTPQQLFKFVVYLACHPAKRNEGMQSTAGLHITTLATDEFDSGKWSLLQRSCGCASLSLTQVHQV